MALSITGATRAEHTTDYKTNTFITALLNSPCDAPKPYEQRKHRYQHYPKTFINLNFTTPPTINSLGWHLQQTHNSIHKQNKWLACNSCWLYYYNNNIIVLFSYCTCAGHRNINTGRIEFRTIITIFCIVSLISSVFLLTSFYYNCLFFYANYKRYYYLNLSDSFFLY